MKPSMSHDDLEPTLRAWLDEAAADGMPGYVDEILARIDGVDQRRDWLVRRGIVPFRPPMVPVSTRLLIAALLVLALLVAVIVGFGGPRRLPEPFGPNAGGLIAFDAGGDIHVATADGSARRALTSTPEHEFGATWSPTGDRIAYWSAPEANGRLARLWVVDADGGNPRLVSADPVDADPTFPAVTWSPDGGRLAFATATGELWVGNADGSGLQEIGSTALRRSDPAWSPNGDVIAFFGEGDTGVYVIRADGTSETKVSSGTSLPVSMRLPAWSPDGQRLAYHVTSSTDNGDIAVATRGAGGWTQAIVIGGPTNDAWPRFSADGGRLVFLRSAPNTPEGTAWIAGVDGTAPQQIAEDLLGWAPLCLSPRGDAVLAVGGQAGAPLGSEERPRVLVLHLGRDSPTTTFDVPGRLSFAACSWQPRP